MWESILIASIFFLIFFLLDICIFFGKFGIVIAGYNISNKIENVKKQHKAIMRRVGIALFLMTLCIYIMILMLILGYRIVAYCMIGAFLLSIIIGICLLNTKKMKEYYRIVKDANDEYEKNQNKKQ